MRKLVAFLTLLVCVGYSWNAAVAVETGALKITEMAITTKIARGNPIDAVRRISSRSVRKLYCFTRTVNPGGEDTTLKHVWFKDGEQVSESELKVKGAKWRTWSQRPIDRDSVGAWRVEARDGDGKVLKAVEFRVN